MASFSEAPRPRRNTSRSTPRQVVAVAVLATILIAVIFLLGAVR